MMRNSISIHPQLVIGLGTGRCGTDSLARFLDVQEGADVTHELFRHKLLWRQGEARIDKFLQWVQLQTDQRIVGDVASAYLPYVDYLLAAYPQVKFICLQRARAATIESFMQKTLQRNHWIEHDGTVWQVDEWDACFPKYQAASKQEAIGLYWDEYYTIAAQYQSLYPMHFRIFCTDALNHRAGQQAILDFLELPRQQMRLPTLRHYNQAKLPSSAWANTPETTPPGTRWMGVGKAYAFYQWLTARRPTMKRVHQLLQKRLGNHRHGGKDQPDG